MKPNGPSASMTGSNPRTAWWLAPWRSRWNAALAEVQRLERAYVQARQEQLVPLTDGRSHA